MRLADDTQAATWSIEGLAVAYRLDDGTAVQAVSDITFELEPGRTVAVVGESGSGKSTVASALTGLIAPNGFVSNGRIVCEEGDLIEMSERRLCELRGSLFGFLPQQPMAAMNPTMTIGRQVAESAVIHEGVRYRDVRPRVVELMTALGLRDPEILMDQYPHQLSGGMLQRILLAAALISNPKVLIADEPTSALDAASKWQIVDLLAQLSHEQDLAVMLITHDISVVERAADDVVVMYGGRLVERGSAQTVLSNPRHPYTQGLLASRVTPSSVHQEFLPEIPGTPPSLETLAEMNGCPFAGRCPNTSSICTEAFPELAVSDQRAVACHHPLEVSYA